MTKNSTDFQHKKMSEHWYKIYITECVLCGTWEETRVRVYGKKPDDPYKTHIYMQTACGGHFL